MQKDREEDWYWCTVLLFGVESRQIAKWNGRSWWVAGHQVPFKDKLMVMNVNEKKITEDGNK
jgi:hypothetical protein